MEGAPQPQHRDNIQDLLDKAHDEAMRDNQELTEKKIIDEQYNHITDADIKGAALENETWLNELRDSLKKLGSKAEIDKSIEGGVINLEIDEATLEKLKDYESAIKAFEEADNNSRSFIGSSLNDMKELDWENPQSNLNLVVVKHGKTTEAERDKLVTDMDKLGYRVPVFSELISLAMLRSDLKKTNKNFVAHKKYYLQGVLMSPYLSLDSVVGRALETRFAFGIWDDGSGRISRDCFLFVRK